MKKTFISLLALAGVAAAAPSDWTCDSVTVKDLNKLVSGTSVHTWDVSKATGFSWSEHTPFSIALTLDVTKIDSAKNYAVMSIKDHSAKHTYNGLASVAIRQGSLDFILWNETAPHASVSLASLNAKSSLTIVFNRDNDSTVNLVAYADGNFDRGTALKSKTGWIFGGQEFAEINFGGSTSSYLGNVDKLMPSNKDAAQFTLTGAAYMTGGVATADQLRTYYHLVPEPTTACLSLLALAGLAARRRRR